MAISVHGVVARGKGEPVQVTEVLVPEPGPGEALIRIARIPGPPAGRPRAVPCLA